MNEEKTEKILSLFFENPTREFHLREISALIKVSPATVSRRLKKFIFLKILSVKKNKPILEVNANLESKIFLEAKKNYYLRKIKESGLLDFLIEAYNYPETIVLFGSYAKGEDTEKSDIDMAIITEKKLNLDLDNFEKRLKRKIHILEIKRKEIKPTLMNNIANGIVLYGYLKVR